ncbi:hypothetical protein [Halobacillus halophilus]|uniref:hypothetical protein n=1 Tax=Halobacillus halophilus TaxID=1570 RepID=UPI001CD1F592|nr:hypothetical protein [Halobacillus halophilus]MCA1012705.1 hypothetical protein [Halobacillus halophilus]
MRDLRDLGFQQNIDQFNRYFYTVLLFVYFMLSPFYLFSSGLPQLSDFTLVSMFVFLIFSRPLLIYQSYKLMMFTGVCFAGYTIFVNSFWSFWLSDYSILYSSAFYVFNIMTVFVFLLLYEKLGDYLFKIVYLSISISTVLQFFLSFFFTSGQYRESLFYNNPNQLGYASLASLGIILITSHVMNRGRLWFLLSVISCLVLIAASLSKAATISGGLMLITWIILSRRWSVKVNALLVAMVIGFIFFTMPELTQEIADVELISNLDDRMNDIGKANDDNPANRGYDRIINDSEYLVFGAGEGAYTRFDSKLSGYEIHSTFGNLFFCYGLIGLLLFLFIIAQSISRKSLAHSSPLFFVLLYGIAHNGIRNTIFWVLISLIYLSYYSIENAKEAARNEKA